LQHKFFEFFKSLPGYFCGLFNKKFSFTMLIKRVLLILLILVSVAIAAIYILIPARLKVVETSAINVNTQGAFRTLLNESTWSKWWPGPKVFTYNRQSYRLRQKLFNAFEVMTYIEQDSLGGFLQLIPLQTDSTVLMWSYELKSSNNPIKRFMQYHRAKAMKENLAYLLGSLKSYLEKEENVYGFTVNKMKVTDSVLISTRSQFNHYPDAADINAMIQKLRLYITEQKAAENNFPMVNVLQTGARDYEAMVAIAVDRILPATKEFAYKQLLKGGNLLEAEVKGGPFTVNNALNNFENYKQDYKYTSPAIPYQLLITDRVKESDTTKWITKLYYPVF
jgi:hypothetical protein